MKVTDPIKKVKSFATDQSLKIGQRTYAHASTANSFLSSLGNVSLFITQIFRETFSSHFEFKEFFRQCFQIGYKSLPLIAVTGGIMGIVLTIQSRPALVDFGAVTLLPGMVAVSLIREIGPVVTALICAGKIGSGMGAELGSMKVSEQIDAMEVSATNPFKYLVVTRVLAATLMLPILVLFADAFGLVGSWAGVNIKGNVNLVLFVSQAFGSLDFIDFFPALIKSVVFGTVIGIVGCYKGYTAGRGTESVGIAANSAVVISSLLVIVVDMIAVQITDMLHMKNPESNMISKNTGMAVTSDPLIIINNLKMGFNEQSVLRDVSLKLFNGENLVVLGKSGSGKSVLIKCIVRLLIPDSGNIEVFGRDLKSLNRKELDEVRKKIGFLFQSGALYDSMTVKQNLEFPLRRMQKKITEKEITEKIGEALENVGLSDALNKMPSQLSGGMRKRISLARTIVVDPLIMLYDEPTTGLDPATSDEISSLINDVQKKYKTSSLIITHDIECARTTADRIIMLNEGEIVSEGSLDDFEKSTDPLIKSFFK